MSAMAYGQAVMEAEMAEELHSKPSQRGSILIYLKAGNAITDIEALRLFQCRRLAARILELKRMGHQIQSRMVEVMSGKRVAEYSMLGMEWKSAAEGQNE
jgi:hypothetical protein